MGNGASKSTQSSSGDDFKNKINVIATKFILGQKFKELKNLVNEQYCDNLMILTKDILADNFTTVEIKNLAMGATMYISKTDFKMIESGMRNKKLLMCKGIARFYVRIAHMFAAIITTVSPNWNPVSSSNEGSGLVSGLVGGAGEDNDNFCNVRIDALLGATKLQGTDKIARIQPTVCSVYASPNGQTPLLKQPGMSYLDRLYNDVYDDNTGEFTGKSIGMQAKYESDLKKLYVAFTGNTSKPDNIKSFGDINIMSLNARYPEECGAEVKLSPPAPIQSKSSSGMEYDRYRGYPPIDETEYIKRETEVARQNAEASDKYLKASAKNFSGKFSSNTTYQVPRSSGAFSNYAAHIETMKRNANSTRYKLLEIIDKVFLIVSPPPGTGGGNSEPIITIHPNLTYDMLDTLINQTRETILRLYSECERDFYKGMSLLHAIVEEIMLANLQTNLSALKASTNVIMENIVRTAATKQQNIGRDYAGQNENPIIPADQIVAFEDATKN